MKQRLAIATLLFLVVASSAHAQRAYLVWPAVQPTTAVYKGPLDAITTGASGYQCYSVEPCSTALGNPGTTLALNVANSVPTTCDLVVGITGVTPTLKTAVACSSSGVTAATFCGASCTINNIYDQNGGINCSGSTVCKIQYQTGTQPTLVFSGCPGTTPYCINANAGQFRTVVAENTTAATQTMAGVFEEKDTTVNNPIYNAAGSTVLFEQNCGSTSGAFCIFNGSTLNASGGGSAAPINAWHAVIASFNSTSSGFVDIDNTVTTGATGSGAASGQMFLNQASANLLFTTAMYNLTGAISSSDATALCHNFSVNFGLSLSC